MNGAFRNGIVYSIYQENNVWKYKVNKAIDSPYNQ
jgi:hypothetical protein